MMMIMMIMMMEIPKKNVWQIIIVCGSYRLIREIIMIMMMIILPENEMKTKTTIKRISAPNKTKKK